MHIRLRHIEGKTEVTPEEFKAVEVETELEWTRDILAYPDPEIADQADEIRAFIDHVMDYRSEQGLALPNRILAFNRKHPGEIEHLEDDIEVFHELVVDFRSLYGDVFYRAATADGTVEDFEQSMISYVDGVAKDVHALKHLVAEKSGRQLGVIEAEHMLSSGFGSMAFDQVRSFYPNPIQPRRMAAFVHVTKGPVVGPNGELLDDEVEVIEQVQVGFNTPSEAKEAPSSGVLSSSQLAS